VSQLLGVRCRCGRRDGCRRLCYTGASLWLSTRFTWLRGWLRVDDPTSRRCSSTRRPPIRIRTLSDKVRKTPVYVAMGISLEGHREILRLWYGADLSAGESASWWANVLVELQDRGLTSIGESASQVYLKRLHAAKLGWWPRIDGAVRVFHVVPHRSKMRSR